MFYKHWHQNVSMDECTMKEVQVPGMRSAPEVAKGLPRSFKAPAAPRPSSCPLAGGLAVPNSDGTFLNFCDFRWHVHEVPLGIPPGLAPLPTGQSRILGQKSTEFGLGIACILARIWSHIWSHFGSVFDRFWLRFG